MEVPCANSDVLVCSCCASAFTIANDDNLKDPNGVFVENKIPISSSLIAPKGTFVETAVDFPEYLERTDKSDWANEESADVKWQPEVDVNFTTSAFLSKEEEGDLPKKEANQNSQEESASETDNQYCSEAEFYQVEVTKNACTLRNDLESKIICPGESSSEANDKENVCPSRQAITFPSFSKERIPEILALLFEYPYVLRKEKTQFNGEQDAIVFCPNCEVALSKLYCTFRDFVELLKTEGQVHKILGRVGNEPEPLLPLLVYDTDSQNENEYGKSSSKPKARKLPRGLKQNEDNSQDDVYKSKQQKSSTKSVKVGGQSISEPRLTTRQKKLSASLEPEPVDDLEENNASTTDEDMSGSEKCDDETDEDFDITEADCEHNIDDDSDDPTFSPKKRRCPAERKPELKRRGRKSYQRATSSAEGGGSDVESKPKLAKKKKRVRNLKKEFWIDKAKNDPTRTCDICGKAFLYARMMQHHKSTVHEGKKPYECEFCGRGFTQNFILKKHTCDYSLAGGDKEFLRIAREEQLFKFTCEVCGKRFKERSSLAVHQKNHTGESYTCEKCGKTFRRPDHLKTHVKIVHSDEKRFVCTICGQRFKTSSNLRAHERKHANPDQKHLCSICGKSIKTLSQMGRHQKTHEDVLPFECHICGKRFKMKDYLGQHLRKGKSCALKARSKPQQGDASTSESQDFLSIISFQSSEPQSGEISLPGRQSAIITNPMEFHYVLGTETAGILTTL